MNTALGLHKSVLNFSTHMFRRLLCNIHKEHWSKGICSRNFLINELEKRLEQLKLESKFYNTSGMLNTEEVINKCADIANFAMMISENYEKDRFNSAGELKPGH